MSSKKKYYGHLEEGKGGGRTESDSNVNNQDMPKPDRKLMLWLFSQDKRVLDDEVKRSYKDPDSDNDSDECHPELAHWTMQMRGQYMGSKILDLPKEDQRDIYELNQRLMSSRKEIDLMSMRENMIQKIIMNWYKQLNKWNKSNKNLSRGNNCLNETEDTDSSTQTPEIPDIIRTELFGFYRRDKSRNKTRLKRDNDRDNDRVHNKSYSSKSKCISGRYTSDNLWCSDTESQEESTSSSEDMKVKKRKKVSFHEKEKSTKKTRET